MIWQEVAPHNADGAILTRTITLPGIILRKGTVLDRQACATLADAGVERVTVVRLDQGDAGENEAAQSIAAAIAGPCVQATSAAAGRVNLIATVAGLACFDRAGIDRLNGIDEAITIATLPPDTPVAAGDVLATIKIIPFAVSRDLVTRAATGVDKVQVHPFQPMSAVLIHTIVPGMKPWLTQKTSRLTAERLKRYGGTVVEDVEVEHDSTMLAGFLAKALEWKPSLILVAGGAAIMGREDVIPVALAEAGGSVIRLGMPVEPGNLLMLGELHGTPVIGMPGCARSPVPNGIDLVLARLAAGLRVDTEVIASMGVGGLLLGQDRAAAARRLRVCAIVLAAGLSRRMAPEHKLLMPLYAKPVIRHTVAYLESSCVCEILVVVGHRAAEIETALAGTSAMYVHNLDYADGIGSSLATGARAVSSTCEAALVCLGDMPLVQRQTVEALIAAFDPENGRDICIPVFQSRRGHPILFGAAYLPRLASLNGDRGAKAILDAAAGNIVEVPVDDPGILQDADTPAEFEVMIAASGLHSRL